MRDELLLKIHSTNFSISLFYSSLWLMTYLNNKKFTTMQFHCYSKGNEAPPLAPIHNIFIKMRKWNFFVDTRECMARRRHEPKCHSITTPSFQWVLTAAVKWRIIVIILRIFNSFTTRHFLLCEYKIWKTILQHLIFNLDFCAQSNKSGSICVLDFLSVDIQIFLNFSKFVKLKK